jgi:hypothetical protein
MGSSGDFDARADFGGILQSLRRLERVSMRTGFAKMRAWPVLWRQTNVGFALVDSKGEKRRRRLVQKCLTVSLYSRPAPSARKKKAPAGEQGPKLMGGMPNIGTGLIWARHRRGALKFDVKNPAGTFGTGRRLALIPASRSVRKRHTATREPDQFWMAFAP